MRRRIVRACMAAALSMTMLLGTASGCLADAALPAAAEEETRQEISERNVFPASWQRISRELTQGYALLKEAPALLLGIGEKPAAGLRLSVTPEALQVAGLLTETFAGADLSWIDEMGIDLFPVLAKGPGEYRMNRYYSSNVGRNVENPYLVDEYTPGLEALWHINGQKILSADLVVDLFNEAMQVMIPDLVRGGPYERISPLWELYNSSTQLYEIWSGLMLDPVSVMAQAAGSADRLLPPEEMIEYLLGALGQVFENCEADKREIKLLQAGSLSQVCPAYTGETDLHGMILALGDILTEARQDPEFLELFRSYVNEQLYGTYQSNAALRCLVDSFVWTNTGISPAEDSFFGKATLDDLLEHLYCGLAAGEGAWEWIPEKEQAERLAGIQEEPAALDRALGLKEEMNFGSRRRRNISAYREDVMEESAEEESTEAEDGMDSLQRQLEEVGIAPGRPFARGELWELLGGGTQLMAEGLAQGQLRLTREYTPADIALFLLDMVIEEAMDGIEELAEEVPENITVVMTWYYADNRTLAGLDVSLRDEESGEVLQLFHAGSIAGNNGSASQIRILGYEDTDEEMIPRSEILWEDLPAKRSEPEVMKLHITGWNREEVILVNVRDPEGREEACTLDILDFHGCRVVGMQFSRTAGEPDERMSFTAFNEGGGNVTLSVNRNPKTGETGAYVSVRPDYRNNAFSGIVQGTWDEETGNGRFRLRIIPETYNSYYMSHIPTIIRIRTDGLKLSGQGSPAGRISVTESGSFEHSHIPQGMGLTLDLEKKALTVTDGETDYLVLEAYTPDPDTLEKAGEDLREFKTSMGYTRGDFESNWNFALPLKRLLNAGMPEDLLKNAPGISKLVEELVEDLLR